MQSNLTKYNKNVTKYTYYKLIKQKRAKMLLKLNKANILNICLV